MLLISSALPIICYVILYLPSISAAAGRANGLIATGCAPFKLRNGRVRYRFKTGFAHNTCNKGFMLAGEKYMKCTNGRWEGSPGVCVRPTCKKASYPVNGYVFPSHRNGVLNFYCQSGYELVGTPTAFCDGVQWSTHLPVCKHSDKTVSLNCDFEDVDICGWTHDLNHNFDWMRHSGRSNTELETGPQYDHTFDVSKPGHYMYISSSSRNPNDTARLISPVYGVSSAEAKNNLYCLQFYYHMYGASMGELRVYLNFIGRSDWTFKKDKAVFRREGNHGDRWIRGFVFLGEIDEDFQIIFEAVRGGDLMSDTAIDDVEVIPNCNNLETETSTTEETVTDDGLFYLTGITCYNRCRMPEMDSPYSCSCASNCYELNTCCGDYEAYCLDVDGTSLGTETTFDEGTTEVITDTTEVLPSSTSTVATTVKHSTILTTLKHLHTEVEVLPTTSRKTSTPELVTSQSTERTTQEDDIADWIPPTMKDTENLPKEEYNINIVEPPSLYNDNVAVEKSTPKNANLTKIVVITGGAILLVFLGVLVVVKMRRRCFCSPMRRWHSDDSQSDVRFLTSDEVLDFRLATSTL